MVVTKSNIGDVFCLYQTGQHIKILDVADGCVDYLHETEGHITTNNTQFDALVEKDPVRLALFEQNVKLSQTLYKAEYSALTKIYNGQEPMDAQGVLNMVREQQRQLDTRVQQQNPSLAVTKDFLSVLYELGTGSHDTFFGHRVANLSQTTGQFSVDGEPFDYSTAQERLSSIRTPQQTKTTSLDSLLRGVAQKVNHTPSIGKPKDPARE